ncbi:MAG: Primosomal replication protein N'' [Candidatus Erwinia impunctatus]
MKRALLLQQLTTCVEQLAQQLAPHLNDRASQARFDQQLFQCNSSRLGDYLLELQQSLAQLGQSVNDQHTEQVTWIAERLVAQIGALQREIATLSLRVNDYRKTPTSRPHDKLAEYRGYEHRLRTMITDRETQLSASSVTRKKTLQQEIASLEGRLQRCLQAIKKVENIIEHSER